LVSEPQVERGLELFEELLRHRHVEAEEAFSTT